MDYRIFKDCDVNDTILKIKQTLEYIGIGVTERLIKQNVSGLPYSARIQLNDNIGYSFGTNGKGTTPQTALASGYAEFMERLQNQRACYILFSNEKFLYSPNEKIVSIKELKPISKFFGSYEKLIEINKLSKFYENLTYNFDSDNKSVVVPFYSVKENKIVYLPIFSVLFNDSTGMCAGNTPQEALVQGLSEICERYSQDQVLLNQVVMPDLPSDILKKYKKLEKIKNLIENNGYEVIIKDASLGKGLPVISTIFRNKTENFIIIQFGSHPSLPVAIERCFTEFIQGFDIKDLNKTFFYKNETSSKKIYLEELNYRVRELTIRFKENNFVQFLFKNKAKYQFSNSTFVDDNTKYSNQELLNFMYNKVRTISKDIFILDVSFLEFPAYYIFIPKMICQYNPNTKILKKENNFFLWFYSNNMQTKSDNIDSLMSALKFELYTDKSYRSPTRKRGYSFIFYEYLLLLCYIVKKDIRNVLKYIKLILSQKKNLNENGFIYMLDRYYTLKNLRKKNSEIDRILCKEYGLEKLNEFKNYLSNISFQSIKNLIKYKHKDISSEHIDNIKKNLITMYINNCPDSMELAKFFN